MSFIQLYHEWTLISINFYFISSSSILWLNLFFISDCAVHEQSWKFGSASVIIWWIGVRNWNLAMEGYDLFSDDLPSLGSSMLEGLSELGGTASNAEQYPSSSNQGQGQSHGEHTSEAHLYAASSVAQNKLINYGSYHPSGVRHWQLKLYQCYRCECFSELAGW